MELIYSLVAERQKQIALAAGIARPGPAIAAEVGQAELVPVLELVAPELALRVDEIAVRVKVAGSELVLGSLYVSDQLAFCRERGLKIFNLRSQNYDGGLEKLYEKRTKYKRDGCSHC